MVLSSLPLVTRTLPRPRGLTVAELGQPGQRRPQKLRIEEVEAIGPNGPRRVVLIEGEFGKAEVEVRAPSMTALFLRSPTGLDTRSILARKGAFPWATGGYSYVVADDGRRYSSRLTKPKKWEIAEEGGRKSLHLAGVELRADTNGAALAEEEWTLTTSDDGARLVWTVTRRWIRDCASTLSGTPGIFFNFDQTEDNNSVTSTFWYDPLRVSAEAGPEYALTMPDYCYRPRAVSKNNLQTIKDRDTWAIYKLWTNWHTPIDLRLEVRGGYLYRRGGFAAVGEAGAVTTVASPQIHRGGDSEQVSLSIGGINSRSTGHQMVVNIPDKKLESAAFRILRSASERRDG